jgi:hypothetical protein
MAETHGGYKLLRALKEQRFPDRRTRIGASLKGIERNVREYFGELTPLQEIELLFTLLPLMGFLLKKPMCNEGGGINEDSRWASNRLNKSLGSLRSHADKKDPKVLDVNEYLRETYGK